MLGVKFLLWFKVEILLSANSVFVFHNGIIEKIGKNYDLNLRKKEGVKFLFFCGYRECEYPSRILTVAAKYRLCDSVYAQIFFLALFGLQPVQVLRRFDSEAH